MRAYVVLAMLLTLGACQERRDAQKATPRTGKALSQPREQVRFCDQPPAGNEVVIDYPSGMSLYGDVSGPIEHCPAGDCVLRPLPLVKFDGFPRQGEVISKNAGGYQFTMTKPSSSRHYRIRALKTERRPGEDGIPTFEYVFDQDRGIVSVTTPLFARLTLCRGRMNFDDIERLMRTTPTGEQLPMIGT